MLSHVLSDIRYRVRALFARASVERELDRELRFHIEREAEKYERQGMARDDAIRRAHLEFGGVEQMKELSRDTRGTARLESVARDLRYAIRSLRSRPAFTLTVIATLALGIGANTAIFTLVDALLLRPLPVSHPEQLVIVSDPAEVNNNNVGDPVTDFVSFLLYRDVRARNTVFTDMYASGWSGPIDVQMGSGTGATVEQPHARFVTSASNTARQIAGRVAIDTTLDARVLAFTAALALACVLLFGLLPALRATGAHVDLATSLRSQGRNVMGAARVQRFGQRINIPFGRALVVAQIALSMLLLIGGGLLVRSMRQLLHSDIGVDRDHVVAVRVPMHRSPYVGARLGQFRRDLAARVGRIPGVDAVAFADHGLFSGGASGYRVKVPGFVPHADSERRVSLDHVGPDFFHAIGARLIRGRDIEPRDLEGSPAVVINETTAKRYFGARDPVGSTLTLDGVPYTYTIVGVVRDFQSSDVRGKPRREIYPVFNDPNIGDTGHAKLVVHVRGDPARFVGPIRQAVEDVDRTLPNFVDPVNDLVRGTVSQDVLLVQVTLFFCIVTLVLAALGLYGVTAYSTSQRTSEFGLRAALGAEPGNVTRMVLGEAVRVAMIGVAIGVPAGLAATRLIRAQLFDVGTIDLPSLGIAIIVLVATAVVASYLPARRAARVGPLEALRLE